MTPDLSNLGTLNQVFIASSQAFSYLLYYILSKVTDSELTQWFWVSEFLVITIVIQTILFITVFPY